jgi:hypothetical protein
MALAMPEIYCLTEFTSCDWQTTEIYLPRKLYFNDSLVFTENGTGELAKRRNSGFFILLQDVLTNSGGL